MPDVDGDRPAKKKFKSYPIGYFHIDIAEVRTEQGKLHMFVAIDRTKVCLRQTAREGHHLQLARVPPALDCSRPLQDPHRVHRQRDPVHYARRWRVRCAADQEAIANGERIWAHAFEYTCATNDIEHRGAVGRNTRVAAHHAAGAIALGRSIQPV
ncbi:hypothetical protein GGI64_001865 [Rhizobium leguminosarum]|uniref:Transposase n=1 Tax=Rhizobium leguminosarum TaxID=384 RepID=A0A7Z0DWT9_RHILE|nr:hypothetical protein [Rhizobium leguminosarum]